MVVDLVVKTIGWLYEIPNRGGDENVCSAYLILVDKYTMKMDVNEDGMIGRDYTMELNLE